MRVTILLFAITIILLLPLLFAPVVTKAQESGKFFVIQMPMLCADTAEMLRVLETHKELPVSGGETHGAHVFIYRKEDRSTWSIVGHYENGKSCLLALGTDWQFGNPFLIIPPKGDAI